MPMRQTLSRSVRAGDVAVWDALVHLGQWALVAAFALAYLSAEQESAGPDPLHEDRARRIPGCNGPGDQPPQDIANRPMPAARLARLTTGTRSCIGMT
jgi:hypothetical protein